MSAEVIVVGSLAMDYIFRTPHLPRAAETVLGHSFATAAGGKGANQAVAAARLGAKVAFVACVGDDDIGRTLRAGYERDGIDCAALGVAPGHATGAAMIAVDDEGRNAIIVAPGANSQLSPEVAAGHADVIDAAKFIICQLEIPVETVAWAIRRAHAVGAKVVLNPAPVLGPLPPDWYPSIDYLIANEIEAEYLSGIAVTSLDSARAAARHLRAAGATNVLVTLGAEGVFAATGDGVERHFPAIRVKAVDTTAAGDTFVGGFVASLAAGRSVADAVGFGQAAASISVTRHGAQPSIPRLDEIRQDA
jgi:ribokinase